MANVWKKISLKVWPTWTGSGVSTSSMSFKEDFVESMANVWKKISLKVWPTWTGSGVSTSSTSFKEDFVESMANVWKKISLKVWPTWTGSGVSTSSMSFKEDFVESMANVSKKISLKVWPTWTIDHQPLFESKELLRSSEMKEDGLRFVLRVSEELYLNIYWILNIIWMYNICIYIFLDQATPTSLEMEEINVTWRSTPNKSKLTFRSQEKWSAESDDQPLFDNKQRLLAWKLKKFRFVYVYV